VRSSLAFGFCHRQSVAWRCDDSQPGGCWRRSGIRGFDGGMECRFLVGCPEACWCGCQHLFVLPPQGKAMKKPNLFIIGAPKCGTTALAKWLSDRPEI